MRVVSRRLSGEPRVERLLPIEEAVLATAGEIDAVGLQQPLDVGQISAAPRAR